ncbi:MAG: TPM domain-containing protein [Muribaculaceae bacterium]|nr:TPM domain-containing protein [Muribaculaceae bacterium]
MKRLILLVITVLAGNAAVYAGDVTYPERPNLTDADNYIYDPYHYVPVAATTQINERIARLRARTTCEMAICVIKTLDGMSIEDYSYNLFKMWGIGKADKNNGVLIVMVYDDHKVRIEVGSGAEGVLTDIACANIIRNDIRPAMVAGDNVAQALNSATETIYAAMTDPAVADELRSEQGETAAGTLRTLNGDVIWDFIKMVAVCAFFITLCLFLVTWVDSRKLAKYQRAVLWRNRLSIYFWSLLFSLGSTLPVALVALFMYRRARNSAEICPTCGAKMHKLGEEEDNLLLSPSQDFEEQLGTIDYDVWECPDCGTIERFPYIEKQKRYTKCPNCGTVAMKLICDKVIVRPTTRSEGEGVRSYQCEFCNHRHDVHYRIPKKTDDSSALLAGAVIGSMLGGGGGRGGGFGGGGSFGGGMSSGGGASGSW